jgi:hypothetical protein
METGAEAVAELGWPVSSGGTGLDPAGDAVDAGVEQAATKNMRTATAPIGRCLVNIWTSFHSPMDVAQTSLGR